MANLYVEALEEGVILPENHYLLSGKLAQREGAETVALFTESIVGAPLVMLPSKEPEKLVFLYFEVMTAPWVSVGKDTRKAMKLPDDWKGDANRFYILPLQLVESGSGKWVKYPSPVAPVLAKKLEFEIAYDIKINFGAPNTVCQQAMTNKFIGGDWHDQEMSDRESSLNLKGIIEFNRSTLTLEHLDAVKAFCLNQSVRGGGGWGKAETLAERIEYRLAWIQDENNLVKVAEFAGNGNLTLDKALEILLT